MSNASRTGVFDIRETPELAELIRQHGRNMAVQMRTATVGKIKATQQQLTGYDAVQQLCSIEVQQLTTLIDPEDSTEDITQGAVVLANVPVAWPRTSSGYLTFPLSIGDTGELIVQDRSLQEWLTKGIAVDPVDNWTHGLSDAVFHPGLHSKLDPIIPPTDTNAAVFEGDLIKIGRTALLAAARVTDTTVANAAMTTWITQVTVALTQLAAAWTVSQSTGLPVIALPAPPMVPPVSPADFGLIATGSATVTVK